MKKLIISLLIFLFSIVTYAQNKTEFVDTLIVTQNKWCYIGYYLSIVADDTTHFQYVIDKIEYAMVHEEGCVTIVDELNEELNPLNTALTLNHLTIVSKENVDKYVSDKNPSDESMLSYVKAVINLKLDAQYKIFKAIGTKKWY